MVKILAVALVFDWLKITGRVAGRIRDAATQRPQQHMFALSALIERVITCKS